MTSQYSDLDKALAEIEDLDRKFAELVAGEHWSECEALLLKREALVLSLDVDVSKLTEPESVEVYTRVSGLKSANDKMITLYQEAKGAVQAAMAKESKAQKAILAYKK